MGVLFLSLVLLSAMAGAQELSGAQTAILFQIQRILEYPEAMFAMNRAQNLCNIPGTPNFSIFCAGDSVTEISISGDGGRLSSNFSMGFLLEAMAGLPDLYLLSLTLMGLWGPIGGEIARLEALRELNLSENFISGEIPPSIFSLPSIQRLDLSRNLLSGEVSSSLGCSPSLEIVDLSGNQLAGFLPGCIARNSSSLLVLAAASVSPSSAGPAHKLGFVLAILGGALFAGFFVALVFLLRRRRRSVKEEAKSLVAAAATTPVCASPRLAPDERTTPLRMGSYPGLQAFAMDELEEATNGFDPANRILDSPLRSIYLGRIRDGSTVAVVRTDPIKKPPPQRAFQFMDVVSRLRHPHLCGVLGHCVQGSVFLVLERPNNGSLRTHLTDLRRRKLFKWPQRVAAAVAIARGLRFLHAVTVPAIAGNDLSAEHVLLDRNLTAKIAHYNLPTLSEDGPFPTIQNVEGGEEEDIYRLGLILLELITGEADGAKRKLESALDGEDRSMLDLAVDPAIRGTYAIDSIRTAAELALCCAADDPRLRPPIDDVLWNLLYAAQVQDLWAADAQ
ncbi:putative LRR receptor-like serine/threonine-protein kinase At1g14390 [Wolffia australiana]